jgi:hypothetical protein
MEERMKIKFKDRIYAVPSDCESADSAKSAKWALRQLGAEAFLRSRKLRRFSPCVQTELEQAGAAFVPIEDLVGEEATLSYDTQKLSEEPSEEAAPEDNQERSQELSEKAPQCVLEPGDPSPEGGVAAHSE